MVLIQFQWHLASALGRAPICVHANRRTLPVAPCTWAALKGPSGPACMPACSGTGGAAAASPRPPPSKCFSGGRQLSGPCSPQEGQVLLLV